MEFVIALKTNIPPDQQRDFFELNWFYERYIEYKNSIEESSKNQLGGLF